MSVDKIKSGCLIAISLFSVVYGAADVKSTTETNFSEVLGNISKVNDLIQDLIMNYKQLKKMTKSDLESDYDADKPTGLFQEDNAKVRNDEKVTASSKQARLITAMFLSDGETGPRINDKNESDNTKKERLKKKKAKKQKGNKHNQPQPTVKFDGDDPKRYSTDVIKNPSTIKRTVKKGKNLDSINDDQFLQPALDTIRDIMKSLSDNPAIRGKSQPSRNVIYPESIPSTPSIIMTPTTRFPHGSIFEIQLGSTPSKKRLEPIIENYDVPRSKRPSSQWPGRRKVPRHEARARTAELSDSEIRESGRTTDVSDPVVRKRPRKRSHIKTDKKPEARGVKKIPGIEVVLKDEIKTNALRKAYGDACMRLVLRKCYMACKGVLSESCRGRRMCTKQFKATFKKSAIHSCDNEFHNNSANFRVANTDAQRETDGFIDLTRDGYLAMACLPGYRGNDVKLLDAKPKEKIQPIMRSKTRLVARQKTKPVAPEKKPPTKLTSSPLNILRDRYEKACQRESALKCFKACKFATNDTCDKEGCKTRKREGMIKSCKKRCRQMYGAVEHSDSDSSDSSSDSKSESKRKKSDDDWE